jgi:acetyl esterase/lipase
LYGGDVDPKRLALDIAGGPQLPPTLIQAGGMEMLGADVHRLAADIRAAGGRCELRVWPDQVHVFQALPPLTPEAAKAMRRAASFIAESLRANTVEATQERTG